jgi:hypothetical protein
MGYSLLSTVPGANAIVPQQGKTSAGYTLLDNSSVIYDPNANTAPTPYSPPTPQELATARQQALNSTNNLIGFLKEKATPEKADYVTASQAKIYIGGIHIDDAYDISYQYRETKEPIYGYNSQKFTTIARGQIIVHGTFTINYKFDGYLLGVLDKVDGLDYSVTSDDIVSEIYDEKQKAINYSKELNKYKAIQDEINKLIRDQAAAQQALSVADAASIVSNDATSALTGIANELLSKAMKTRDAYMDAQPSGFAADYNTLWTKVNNPSATGSLANFEQGAKTYMDGAAGQIMALNARLVALRSTADGIAARLPGLRADPTTPVDTITTYENQYTIAQSSILTTQKDLDKITAEYNNYIDAYPQQLAAKKSEIKALIAAKPAVSGAFNLEQSYADASLNADAVKENTGATTKITLLNRDNAEKKLKNIIDSIAQKKNDISAQLEKVKAAKVISASEKFFDAPEKTVPSLRRAEDTAEFTLAIEYNGYVHKIIDGCTLTGHGHMLGQQGQPVQEYYTFIARTIK